MPHVEVPAGKVQWTSIIACGRTLSLVQRCSHFPIHLLKSSFRAVVKKKKKAFVTPPETNVHGDALCFMVKTWARYKTTETVLNNVWRLVVVGGWWLVVGGWRRLVARYRIFQGCGMSPPPPPRSLAKSQTPPQKSFTGAPLQKLIFEKSHGPMKIGLCSGPLQANCRRRTNLANGKAQRKNSVVCTIELCCGVVWWGWGGVGWGGVGWGGVECGVVWWGVVWWDGMVWGGMEWGVVAWRGVEWGVVGWGGVGVVGWDGVGWGVVGLYGVVFSGVITFVFLCPDTLTLQRIPVACPAALILCALISSHLLSPSTLTLPPTALLHHHIMFPANCVGMCLNGSVTRHSRYIANTYVAQVDSHSAPTYTQF